MNEYLVGIHHGEERADHSDNLAVTYMRCASLDAALALAGKVMSNGDTPDLYQKVPGQLKFQATLVDMDITSRGVTPVSKANLSRPKTQPSLTKRRKTARDARIRTQILGWLTAHPNQKIHDIAAGAGFRQEFVSPVVRQLLTDGKIKRRGKGPATTYSVKK